MESRYKVITNELELLLRRMRAEGKTKLPSEMELAASFSCSRQTVRTALNTLAERGLIVKKNGSGSYLADDVPANKQIFFITADADRYRTPELISGLRNRLASEGYELKVCVTGGSTISEASAYESAIIERPAVVIAEPLCDLLPDPNAGLPEKLISSGIPVIRYNSTYVQSAHAGSMHAESTHARSGTVSVSFSNFAGGKSLTGKLLAKGFRKIACIFRLDSSAGTDRYHGYMDAIKDAGIVFDESRCLLLSCREERDIASGKALLLPEFIDSVLSGCDAVICQNGMLAHSLIALFSKCGLSVPGDITVACFDSSYYPPHTLPVISYEYNNDLLCRKLARTALTLAAGGTASDVVIPLDLSGM